MKTQGLKQALDGHKFDVAFGGARRDEERVAQKNEFSLLEAVVIAGTRKTNDRKFGTSITAEKVKVKAFGYSLYLIGRSLISGSISIEKIFRLFHCTSRHNDQLCDVTECLL